MSKGDEMERCEGGGVVSTEDEEDRGLSLSATKDEEPRGALEDAVGSGLLSPSLSRSLFRLRVRSSMAPAPPPRELLWPLMWLTGVLLRGLKVRGAGDILTGCRPYIKLSLQSKGSQIQTSENLKPFKTFN